MSTNEAKWLVKEAKCDWIFSQVFFLIISTKWLSVDNLNELWAFFLFIAILFAIIVCFCCVGLWNGKSFNPKNNKENDKNTLSKKSSSM